MSIDQAVIAKLRESGLKRDVTGYSTDELQEIATHSIYAQNIRSMLLDTGANGSLSFKDIEQSMRHAIPSKYKIAIADKNQTMNASKDGQLTMTIINTHHQPNMAETVDLTITTTTADDLRTELLSFDELYKNGWDLHLTQDSNYMTNSTNNNNHYSRIPLRYNHGKKGGWWLDYVIRDDNNNKRILQANNSNLELEDTQDEMQMLRTQTYDVTSAHDAYNKVLESTQIGNVTQGNEHRAKCVRPQSEFRGVKAGLKNNKAKLTAREFHERYGHIGHCENCQVCKMAKGNMRRITKKIAPHKPELRAHTFTMDMITLSHRSIKGNKYILQMRDKMSSCIYAMPLYLKSQAPDAIKQWILTNRQQSHFKDMGYEFCEILITDEPSEWSERSTKWQEIKNSVDSFDMQYVDVSTSKEAGHAERTNRTLEETLKAIMMQQNLPEDHWEAAMREAIFLLNRFPNTTTTSNLTVGCTDGDRPRPLEVITGSRYTRRQIDRELSYFVSIGTPALVHIPKTRGSSLKPKVRWGVAWGMRREHPIWMCPFTKSMFRSKSFTAFALKDGMNYGQFLGIQMPTIRGNVRIPDNDQTATVTVQLRPIQEIATTSKSPVMRLYTNDDNRTKIKHNNKDNKDSNPETKQKPSESGGQYK